MEKEIVINYQPEVENLAKASRYLLLKLPFIKLVAIGLMAFLLGQLFVPDLRSFSTTAIIEGICVLGLWIFLFFLYLNVSKKNILKNSQNIELQELIFTGKLFRQKGKTFSIDRSWSQIIKIVETKSWFLVYTQKFSAVPIPKNQLSATQYEELKAFFNSLKIQKKLK